MMFEFVMAAGAAALLQAPAAPEDWRETGPGNTISIFVDRASVRRNGTRVRYRERMVWQTPQRAPTGESWDSQTTLVEADCEAMDVRDVSRTTISLGPVRVRRIPARPGKIRPEPGTTGRHTLETVCLDRW